MRNKSKHNLLFIILLSPITHIPKVKTRSCCQTSISNHCFKSQQFFIFDNKSIYINLDKFLTCKYNRYIFIITNKHEATYLMQNIFRYFSFLIQYNQYFNQESLKKQLMFLVIIKLSGSFFFFLTNFTYQFYEMSLAIE